MASPAVGFIDRTLDNRYHITRKIAEGGMASVYEATDERLDKRVAIKIMHTSLAYSQHSEQYIERFHREALSAAALDNPHIVHVFDAGDIDGVGFIVMEYVDGKNLRTVMNQRKYFSVRDTIRIISQILDGLSAAHERNIIHRDIKPENIMINSRGEVQIADFGLAKHTDNATIAPTGMFMGTTTYIAPETASENTSLPASDLYSLGLIMWEMLMGRPPFASDNPVAEVFKHVNEDVPSLRVLAPAIPASLSDFVDSLVRRDYTQRPQQAGSALTQLTRIAHSLTSQQLAVRLDESNVSVPIARSIRGKSQSDSSVSQAPHSSHSSDSTIPRPPQAERSPRTTRPSTSVRARSIFSRIGNWFRKHPSTAAVTAVVVFILVIAAGTGWWNAFGPGSYHSLPAAADVTCSSHSECTVTGADASTYQKLLTDQGIPFTVKRAHSDSVSKGKIISTQPSAVGSHISKTDGSVTITVSTGIEKLLIPSDLLDSSTSNGKDPLTALKNAGFTNIKHSQSDDQYSLTVPKNAAISINPKPGTRVNHNTQITVILSRGLKPVTMPDVVGLSRADALSELNELNLKVTIREEYSSTVDAGKVISQSEDEGTKLTWNDKVTISISKGARSVTIPDVRGMTTSRAQTTLEDLGLKVTVKGSGSSISKQSLSPGEIVSVVNSRGKATEITITTTSK